MVLNSMIFICGNLKKPYEFDPLKTVRGVPVKSSFTLKPPLPRWYYGHGVDVVHDSHILPQSLQNSELVKAPDALTRWGHILKKLFYGFLERSSSWIDSLYKALNLTPESLNYSKPHHRMLEPALGRGIRHCIVQFHCRFFVLWPASYRKSEQHCQQMALSYLYGWSQSRRLSHYQAKD